MKILEVIDLLQDILATDLPADFSEGGVVRDGYDAELDKFRNYERNAAKLLLELETKERKLSGIETLKVGFNNVFGYYFNIPNGQVAKAPDHFIRKQTLANAERFYTQELKEIEDNIINSKQNALNREKEIIRDLISKLEEFIPDMQMVNQELASLDVFVTLANIASERQWVRPEISTDIGTHIEEGRHPVVEDSLPFGKFVSNDLDFNDTTSLALITGPNMGGKSTYLRQNAILLYMAHIGSFVPAKSMKFSIKDGLFSRIGSSDALAYGESTFMVEMNELAFILKEATEKSFVIVDEVGRGTSTTDGLAIAKSVLIEFLENIKCETLFATHFSELILDIDSSKNGVNLHVDIDESNGEIVLLHKVIKGGMAKSFGIHVAKRSGLPDRVIDRASSIMKSNLGSVQALPLIETPLDNKLDAEIQKKDTILRKLINIDLLKNSPINVLSELEQMQSEVKQII